jgi:hypothetical protein
MPPHPESLNPELSLTRDSLVAQQIANSFQVLSVEASYRRLALFHRHGDIWGDGTARSCPVRKGAWRNVLSSKGSRTACGAGAAFFVAPAAILGEKAFGRDPAPVARHRALFAVAVQSAEKGNP